VIETKPWILYALDQLAQCLNRQLHRRIDRNELLLRLDCLTIAVIA